MDNTADQVNCTASERTPLKQEYRRFFQVNKCVMLGTVDKDGNPDTSYACFAVEESDRVYVLVSGFSKHTANMYENPQVSAMFVEDEVEAENIFARQRLTLSCRAEYVNRSHHNWMRAVYRFRQRFQEQYETMAEMPDFRFYLLTPFSGTMILGFAKAYRISGRDMDEFVHVNPDNENPHMKDWEFPSVPTRGSEQQS